MKTTNQTALSASRVLGVLLFSSMAWSVQANTGSSYLERIPLPEDYFGELRSILEMSGRQAPELVQLGYDREIADENLRVAEAAGFPRLDVNGNLGYRYVDRSRGEDNDESLSGDMSVALSRPLYHWGAVNAGIDRGRVDYQNSLIDTKENFQVVLLDLRDKYLELVLNEMLLRNARLRRTIFEQEINQKQADWEAGRLSEESWRLLQIELNQSILEIEELTVQKAQLVRDFRRDAGVRDEMRVPPSIDALNLDELEDLLASRQMSVGWVDETLRLQRAKNEIVREEKTRVIIQSRQRPNINFRASVTQAPVNTANQNDVNTTIYFAGLSVQWNIFDGFETQARRRISLLNGRKLDFAMMQSRANLEEVEQQIRQNLLIKVRRQRLIEERLDLDELIWERAKREYEDGLMSANELRQAQLDFYVEQVKVHQGRADILRMLADYLSNVNADRGLDFLVFNSAERG